MKILCIAKSIAKFIHLFFGSIHEIKFGKITNAHGQHLQNITGQVAPVKFEIVTIFSLLFLLFMNISFMILEQILKINNIDNLD